MISNISFSNCFIEKWDTCNKSYLRLCGTFVTPLTSQRGDDSDGSDNLDGIYLGKLKETDIYNE